MSTTLIIVSMMALSSITPIVQTQSHPDAASCKRVLEAATEGVKKGFQENATGPHQDVQVTVEDGWTVVKTPVGRTVTRMRCQG